MQRLASLARTRGAAVLGLGVSGIAAARYLLSLGVHPLYLIEQGTPRDADAAAELVRGGALLADGSHLPPVGLLIRSPGIRYTHPLVQEAIRSSVTVTNEIGLYLDAARIPILAVTGSDGKTTTATLAHRILTEAGLSVALGGNIGVSLLPTLSSEKRLDLALLELSSFQLLDAFPLGQKCGLPMRAALTGITENHLDFHGTMQEYIDAKRRIFAPGTLCVLPDGLFDTAAAADPTAEIRCFSLRRPQQIRPGRPHYFLSGTSILRKRDGDAEILTDIKGFRLLGTHNLKNLLTAIALTDGIADPRAMRRAILSARPVPHRMEVIETGGSITCIDSSIDSTPSRTAVTLTALSRPVILLLGGAGKGTSLAPLLPLLPEMTTAIVTFGRDGDLLAHEILLSGYSKHLRRAGSFDEAAGLAISMARSGDTVLLSPACTSYDEFRDYTERGMRFAALARELLPLKEQ